MAVIKPFPCIRPEKTVADQVAALPYDVYNRAEAKAAVTGKPLSFLNIDRAVCYCTKLLRIVLYDNHLPTAQHNPGIRKFRG